MKKILSPASISIMLCLCLLLSAFAAEGPIAKNLELTTYRATSVGGRLSAESEKPVVAYEITTAPGKGDVELGEDGSFVYTPAKGKKGRDYFGYKAIDSEGNYSQEATVIIKIRKPSAAPDYSDMEGNPSAAAAVTLAEKGVFVGEMLAGEYVFSPESPVTRAEFLAMCMNACGTEVFESVMSTGFADDAAIPAWARPYAGTALSRGIVTGYEGNIFAAESPVSALEAAVILDRCCQFTDAVAVWFAMDEAVPAWAMQAAANLSSCGITPDGMSLTEDTLTRAQAAEMLCAAMEVIEAR